MANSRSDVEVNSRSIYYRIYDIWRFYLGVCGLFLGALFLVTIIATAVFVIVICATHLPPKFVNLDEVQANFTTTSRTKETLTYSLDLSISLRNPNKRYHVHHQKIDAMTYYNNPATGFGTAASLNSFSQKPKSNALLTPSFKGQIDLGADHEDYILVVKLDLINKYKTMFLGWEATSKFECDLKVPTIDGQSSGTTTEACKVLIQGPLKFPTPLKVYLACLICVCAPSLSWLSELLASLLAFAAFIWLLVIV